MLLIKNAKIYTMNDCVIEKGDILIENGKIKEISSQTKDISYYLNKDLKIKIINGENLVAIPGIIDAHSHIGGFDLIRDEQDINEMTNNITPSLNAIYGIDGSHDDFKNAIKSGITTSIIAPGSANVIGGEVFATKNHGDNIFDMCIKNPVALKVALGGNPKGVYGKINKSPMTRMKIAHIIETYLSKGKEYVENKEKAKENNKEFKIDKELEPLIKVFNKEISLKIHCTQFDMLTAINICKKYDVNFTLDHAWGATDYVDEIVESGCKVIFGPIGVPKIEGECRFIDIDSLIKLDERGTLTSIMTDGPILKPDCIIHQAGEVIKSGGDILNVLKMITINPARIYNLDDKIGSIEVGKDADIVLFENMPCIDTNAYVRYTIVNGEVVYNK